MSLKTPFYWRQATQRIFGAVAALQNSGGIDAIRVTNDGGVNFPTGLGSGHAFVDVTVTAAQMKALNATPKQLVAAPGVGFALVFEGALIALAYGTAAYAGIATGEDLSVKYTDGSGAEVAQCEATGFLDATANAFRFVRPQAAATGSSAITPVANAALVLHMLTGEIITGDSVVRLRVFYRVIPTTLT